MQTQTEVLVTTRREITELRNTLQRLEIELQGHLTMVTHINLMSLELMSFYLSIKYEGNVSSMSHNC